MPRCAYYGGCDRLVLVGELWCTKHRRKLPTASTLVYGDDQGRTWGEVEIRFSTGPLKDVTIESEEFVWVDPVRLRVLPFRYPAVIHRADEETR